MTAKARLCVLCDKPLGSGVSSIHRNLGKGRYLLITFFEDKKLVRVSIEVCGACLLSETAKSVLSVTGRKKR